MLGPAGHRPLAASQVGIRPPAVKQGSSYVCGVAALQVALCGICWTQPLRVQFCVPQPCVRPAAPAVPVENFGANGWRPRESRTWALSCRNGSGLGITGVALQHSFSCRGYTRTCKSTAWSLVSLRRSDEVLVPRQDQDRSTFFVGYCSRAHACTT